MTTWCAAHLLNELLFSKKPLHVFLFFTLCVRGARPQQVFSIFTPGPPHVPWEPIKTNLPLSQPVGNGIWSLSLQVTCLNRDSQGTAWKVFPSSSLLLPGSVSFRSEPSSVGLLPISMAVDNKKSGDPNPGISPDPRCKIKHLDSKGKQFPLKLK